MKHNKYGYATDYLYDFEEDFGIWWRSDETVLTENPYTSFDMRKDWPLKEEMNMHLVRLQQESYQGDPTG